MKQVELNPQFKKPLELNPKNEIIELSQVQVGGVPYVELRDVTIPDWYNNSHIKILSGFYTGNATQIRVRDHYPHSIGSSWCLDGNNIMFATEDTTMIPGAEFKPVIGKDNYSIFKEHCFWGADNYVYDVSESGDPIISSMKYTTFEPLRPEDTPDYYYYGDRMATVGIDYPYGQTPSNWRNASLNSGNKTWSVTLTLNQFTIFEGTAYQQAYNYWKPYQPISWLPNYYPEGLSYDPRLHFIEIEITGSYNGVTVTGSRVYYIWHMPISITGENCPLIQYNTGVYTNPTGLSGCTVGFGIPGCHYSTGFSGSGGDGYVQTQGKNIQFENILFACTPIVCNSDDYVEKKRYELSKTVATCVDEDGNFYIYDLSMGAIRVYNSDQVWQKDIYINMYITNIVYYNNKIYISSANKSNPDYSFIATYDLDTQKITYLISNVVFPKSFSIDSNGNIFVADSYDYKVKKFDNTGTLLLEFGSEGTSGGQFKTLRGVDTDSLGNIYTIDGLSTMRRVTKFDSNGTYITYWTFASGRIPYSIVILNDFAYINFYIANRIVKYNLNFSAVVGVDDRIYTFNTDDTYIYGAEGYGGVTIFDTNLSAIDYIVKRKTIWRQGDKYGIIDLDQIQNAYAVYEPNNFDPTDPGTYTEMYEYSLGSLSLDDEGYINFPILETFPSADPSADYTIYIKANFEQYGDINTYYTLFYFNTGGCSPSGNARTYRWATLAPECSESCSGSGTQLCNRYYDWGDEVITGDEILEVDLNVFDNGTDLESITVDYYWFVIQRLLNYNSGNDGGRSKFWTAYTDAGVKKDYNNSGDITNLPFFGIADRLRYYSDQDVDLSDTDNFYAFYNDDYDMEIIDKRIKNGVDDTVGFKNALHITREV